MVTIRHKQEAENTYWGVRGEELFESDENSFLMSEAIECPFRSEAEIGNTLGVLLPLGTF